MRTWMKLTIVGSLVTIALTLSALVFLRPAATTTPARSVDSTQTDSIDNQTGSPVRSTSGGGNGASSGQSTKDEPKTNPQTTTPPQTPPTTLVAPPAGGGGKPPVADPFPGGGVIDPGPVVRDHRGDNAGGGGVTVSDTPVVRDHRGEGDGPIVRDHRDGAEACVELPFVGTVCSPL